MMIASKSTRIESESHSQRRRRIVERGSEWGSGEGSLAVSRLIELVKKETETAMGVDRRAEIVERMVERFEENRSRRRVRRAFAAGAASVLVAGLLAKLTLVGMPWLGLAR
jgi:hypothetical protein